MVEVRILAALGLIGLASGCGSSYTATVDGVTPMPDGSTFGQASGQLHTGIATGFTPHVSMHDTWGTHDENDNIFVTTSNPGVLQVAAVTGGSGPHWIVWAVAPGSAIVTVSQSENVALEVPVVVTDPK